MIEQDEMAIWRQMPATEAFLAELEKQRIAYEGAILNINATGEELTKQYHELRGICFALSHFAEYANDFSWCNQKEENRDKHAQEQ